MKAVWTVLQHHPSLDYPRLSGMMAQIIDIEELGVDTKTPVYYGRLKPVVECPSYDPDDWVLSSHLSPINDQPETCDNLLFESAWDLDQHALLVHGSLPRIS